MELVVGVVFLFWGIISSISDLDSSSATNDVRRFSREDRTFMRHLIKIAGIRSRFKIALIRVTAGLIGCILLGLSQARLGSALIGLVLTALGGTLIMRAAYRKDSLPPGVFVLSYSMAGTDRFCERIRSMVAPLRVVTLIGASQVEQDMIGKIRSFKTTIKTANLSRQDRKFLEGYTDEDITEAMKEAENTVSFRGHEDNFRMPEDCVWWPYHIRLYQMSPIVVVTSTVQEEIDFICEPVVSKKALFALPEEEKFSEKLDELLQETMPSTVYWFTELRMALQERVNVTINANWAADRTTCAKCGALLGHASIVEANSINDRTRIDYFESKSDQPNLVDREPWAICVACGASYDFCMESNRLIPMPGETCETKLINEPQES